MKNWLLNNKVIITGASSGIGKEIVKILINKYNCQVLGVARNEDKLKNLKQEINSENNYFQYFCCDVGKEESWQKLYEYAKDRYNIIINNAGTMLPFMKFDKIKNNDIERIFNTNMYSCMYSYKAFAENLKNKKDCGIINITSASALCTIPGQSVYSASKSAATVFSKSISAENKKTLFIATYLPGFTKTSLFVSSDNSKPIFSENNFKILNKICMKSSKMASKIVKAIARKKRLKKFGTDAFWLQLLNGLMPTKSTDLYKYIFKKSKLDCFKDIFE